MMILSYNRFFLFHTSVSAVGMGMVCVCVWGGGGGGTRGGFQIISRMSWSDLYKS